VLTTLLIALPSLWGALALWYQLPGGRAVRLLGVVLWACIVTASLLAVWRRRLLSGLIAMFVAVAGLLFWWQSLRPTNQADWADDVAQMSSGAIDGSILRLSNVRHFDWRSDTDYTPRWETRSYDLDHVRSVDMILSYWTGPAIAHLIASFGFDDGEQVAFSVEVRRRRGQTFSEIGGFFREFNLSVIAADERDVVRVRTNVRGEEDYLYRIRLPPAEVRELLLAYVEQANELTRQARYYNTLTANCTSLVFQMMSRIVGHLPLDYRLLLSGYLPEYVDSVSGLVPGHRLDELRAKGRITTRAQAADRSAMFSADIRRGIPGIDEP
jgi:hypothetical protein